MTIICDDLSVLKYSFTHIVQLHQSELLSIKVFFSAQNMSCVLFARRSLTLPLSVVRSRHWSGFETGTAGGVHGEGGANGGSTKYCFGKFG